MPAIDATGAQARFSPAFRVRVLLPAPSLAAHGIEVRPLPLLSDEDDSRFRDGGPLSKARVVLGARRRMLDRISAPGERGEVALIQRQADLFPSLTLEKEFVSNRRLVLDVDDAVWSDARGAGGHPLAGLKGSGRKLRWLARRADQVIAGNEILATWLSKHSERVEVVPSLVDPGHVPLRVHGEGERLTLGWVGSAPTAPYLRRLVPVLQALPKRVGRPVRLLVVGGSPPNVPGVEVEARPWTEQGELDALTEMDVGLMPLPDTVWARGKCAYKALMYMAAGLPVVADDVGITARVVGGGAGAVVGSDESWRDEIVKLASSADYRAELGATGRRRVETRYSIQVWAPRIADLLVS
jgi:glycosyltransferase involved in cell wall biosynthesis